MLDITATLIAVLFSLVTSVAAPVDVPLGQSLALRDDAGVAVLTWDGDTARLYRQGEVQLVYRSDSWNEVLWNVDVPAYGTVTAPHRYERALSAAEVAALDDCDWSNDTRIVECGFDADCDCTAATWVAASH